MGIMTVSHVTIESTSMDTVSDKITLAHISDSVGKLTESQNRIEDKLDPGSENYINAALEERLKPLFEVYDGTKFTWKVFIGIAAVVITLGAAGAVIINLFSWIRHG